MSCVSPSSYTCHSYIIYYSMETSTKERKKIAIGIDLGTTYSCVGIWRDNRCDIIANDQGNRTTPSYVAFTQNERLIGDSAKNQANANPENSIYDAKRLIGREFNDPVVQAEMKLFPFKITLGYFQVTADPVSTCVQEILELSPKQVPLFVTKLYIPPLPFLSPGYQFCTVEYLISASSKATNSTTAA